MGEKNFDQKVILLNWLDNTWDEIMIRIKRVYEPVEESDGIRFFVERLWPRGIKKENLVMQAWLKEVAPSAGLRKWYQHDLAKWEEFIHIYQAELDTKPGSWEA